MTLSPDVRERLAQASWDAMDGGVSGVSWNSPIVRDNEFRGGKERRRVDGVLAALDEMDYRIVSREWLIKVFEEARRCAAHPEDAMAFGELIRELSNVGKVNDDGA